ncbi:hypothetical protein DNTS_007170 [Danionella cerebrum]|uniref:Dynein regulatory complex subunit 5 n=1 Tax=Danionella cerebrum TaxID=2873325 RepID=A0A553N4R8_9TELE|nr:hypothetical protein DNTS_007170 [Danionella translucida]
MSVSKAMRWSMYPPGNSISNGRRMRSIIADDPEWTLALVPPLTTLCLQSIIKHFAGKQLLNSWLNISLEKPILDELMPKYKAYVLERLPTSLPLSISANLISDESFWRRCCKTRWGSGDVSVHDKSWKQMFFERHLQSIIELYIPDSTEDKTVLDEVLLCQNYVKRLKVSQLLPPIKEPSRSEDDDVSDSASDMSSEGPSIDHFDFRILLDQLPRLQELSLVYGVKGCGMNFEWNLFEFTFRDCENLAKALDSCKTLQIFHLHRSKVDDEKCCVIVKHLLDHPCLQEIDFSHNHISDRGAQALGKLLIRGRLKKLNVCNNQIRVAGVTALAQALSRNNCSLQFLDLRLNCVGDEGTEALSLALRKNGSLEHLNLGGNQLSEASAVALSHALVENTSLRRLNLCNNRLGVDGGKFLEEGLSHNSSLLECDVRLTAVSPDTEYGITQALHSNQMRNKQL